MQRTERLGGGGGEGQGASNPDATGTEPGPWACLRLPPPAPQQDQAHRSLSGSSDQGSIKRRTPVSARVLKLQSSFELDGDYEIVTCESPNSCSSPMVRAEYNASIGSKLGRLFSGTERDWSCMEVGPTLSSDSGGSVREYDSDIACPRPMGQTDLHGV